MNGVTLISMGFFAREDQPVVWRGPMLHKALEQFLTDVHWGEPDFLVVDLPPGTGDISISLASFLPRAEVFVVTTPQPAAQRVAQRAAFMAQKVNLEVKGVIENMSWFTGDDGKRYELFGAGGGDALAEVLGVPMLGQVPLVTELRAGGDAGRPIVLTDPAGDAAQTFAAILAEEDGNVQAIAGLARAHLALGEVERAREILALAPADKAGDAAILAAKGTKDPIRLTVKNNDRFRDITLDYHDGPRYPRLQKVGNGDGGLDRLLMPR